MVVVNAPPSDSELLAREAANEMQAFLVSRGLRIDCRAKCAWGKIFYWARVLGSSGQEMAASGGWFEQESTAVARAVAMLRLMDGSDSVN